MDEARLFRVGGSQAVRLPKAFRFDGDRVRVRKVGDCVVLEPLRRSPGDITAWLEEIRMTDFMSGGREQPLPQERDWRDD